MLELVLLVALVILVVVLYKPATKMIFGALDARSARIRHELDEAKRLREEAQALLAKYQRQLHDGENLARDILQRSTADTARLEEKMRADMQAAIERRTQQAMDRIAQEEQTALREVRGKAADLAMRTTRRLVNDNLDEAHAGALMGGAIDQVRAKLTN